MAGACCCWLSSSIAKQPNECWMPKPKKSENSGESSIEIPRGAFLRSSVHEIVQPGR